MKLSYLGDVVAWPIPSRSSIRFPILPNDSSVSGVIKGPQVISSSQDYINVHLPRLDNSPDASWLVRKKNYTIGLYRSLANAHILWQIVHGGK